MPAKAAQISKNQEDYLGVILHLESQTGTATTQEIAKHLNISPSSVSENLVKMTNNKLLKYLPYKGATLTKKGRRLALDIVRRHRLSEEFLNKKLGISWEKVHAEAHKMEHGISKIVTDKLYEMLGRPKTCPHGNPIPNSRGIFKEEYCVPLSTLKKNAKARIIKIVDEEPKLLHHLATLGLLPKTILKIEEKTPFNGPILIKVNNSSYALGQKIAKSIWVKQL